MTEATATGFTEPLLLVFGDGWSRAVAAKMPRTPQEIKGLRDAFAPQVKPGEAVCRADDRTLATLALLIDALAAGAAGAGQPAQAGEAAATTAGDFVGEQNTDLAVRAIWLAAFSPQETTTRRLGAVLRRSLVESCFADAPAIHDACVAALIELDTDEAARTLMSVAEAAPDIGARERLLVAADRAGRSLASQVAESQVPDHGLDADGMRVFAVDRGEYKREYLITLHEDGRVGLTDLDADAPRDEAAEHIASQEAQRVRDGYEREKRRLEALLAADREWDRAEWKRLYWDNAVTRTISRRLAWRFEDLSHGTRADVLLQPDGGFLVKNGLTHPLGSISGREWSTVRLWHPALVDESQLERWRRTLSTLEFAQPFPQIARPALLPMPESKARELVTPVRRRLIRQAFERLLDERGWSRGVEGETTYLARRDFPDDRLTVTLECATQGTEADGLVIRRSAWFHWTADDARTSLPVVEVPPRVYAEAAYDLALLVQESSRPEEKTKAPGRPRPSSDAAPPISEAARRRSRFRFGRRDG